MCKAGKPKTPNYLPGIMDIEASGFGSESYPIEVGIVKSSGERFCVLIKPEDDWVFWSDRAEKVHGIARELLVNKGKPIHEVCDELNRFLGSENVYSDCWSHDCYWLNKMYRHAGKTQTFSLKAIEYIVSEEQLARWDKTKENVLLKLGISRHRASADAFLIQQTFIQSRC